MEFTVAEIALVAGFVIGLYWLMKPVRQKLEHYFLRFFSRGDRRREKPVIDINAYTRNKNKDPEN